MTFRSALSAFVPFLLLPIAAHAALPEYEPPEIEARSNLLVNDEGFNLPPGSSFNSIDPAIDDAANVAFPVQIVPDAGDGHPGVWFGGNGEGALVFEGPSGAFISSASPLDHEGSIVFTLTKTGNADGIYLYDPVAGEAARVNTSPVLADYYGSPDLNADGAIGYQANFAGGRALASTLGSDSVIHVADRGLVPDSPYTYIYTPSFNDRRHIAAKVATSDDQFTAVEIRIFAPDGSSTRILANQATDPDSPYSKFDNSLALNGNDVVAVVATRAADNRRVLVRSDGETTVEIAAVDPAGTIRDIEFFAPAINDAGLVAFRAKDAGGQAIYVGDGEALARVIGDGDAVDTDLGAGQIGQDNATDPIFSGRPAINARGDIAFIAGLYPAGDNQIEWGSGVFVTRARVVVTDRLFADGFEQD
jgi:hypothetical protein